jgi:hypothetical protein
MAEKIRGIKGDGWYDLLWDAIQSNGARTNYANAFNCSGGRGTWTKESFRPKYSIHATEPSNCFMQFNDATADAPQIDLVSLANELGIEIDFSGKSSFYMAFATGGISRIGTVDASQATNMGAAFYGSYNSVQGLVTVERLIVSENTVFVGNTFQDCQFLEHLTVEGVFGNSINLQWSTKLSKNSIKSVISAANDQYDTNYAGFTVTLSLAAVNKAFETSEGANDGSESEEWLNLPVGDPLYTISLI